jgi:hypothetical protein
MSSRTAILDRVIEPDIGDLSPEGAESILRLGFRESDHARMDDLAAKAKAGTLSDEEKDELEQYLLVADFLAILKSKARRSLRRAGQAS